MALNRAAKQAIVTEVSAVAKDSVCAIMAHYRGLTVEEITDLRNNARKDDLFLKVVRNTLARRAVVGTDFECLQDSLVGPSILVFSKEDPGAPARLMRDFSKDHEALSVKAISVGGKLLSPGDLGVLASLPTRDEAIAKLMSAIQGPVVKLVRTLAEPQAKLVRTLAAVRDQKQAA